MPSHSETRTLPYSAEQMYDLVADVARYPKFIPWTVATRIRSVEDQGDCNVMYADMVVGFKMFRERFLSRVTLRHEMRTIDTEYIDGPFQHLMSNWEFVDAATGCEVRFHVDFEFRNRLLRGAAGLFFMDAMQRIVQAFEARADALYGSATATG